jgi:hypothetical protein
MVELIERGLGSLPCDRSSATLAGSEANLQVMNTAALICCFK